MTITVARDVDDLRLSARKGILRIYGKAERVREIPIHPELRKASPIGSRSAATGRERNTARRCFSTSAATG